MDGARQEDELDELAYDMALEEFRRLSAREQQLNEELIWLRARTAELVGVLLPADAPDDRISDVFCEGL